MPEVGSVDGHPMRTHGLHLKFLRLFLKIFHLFIFIFFNKTCLKIKNKILIVNCLLGRIKIIAYFFYNKPLFLSFAGHVTRPIFVSSIGNNDGAHEHDGKN
jgi:hypothetical protein